MTDQMIPLPLHLIERIRAEMRLGPGCWAEFDKWVEAAQTSKADVLPCDVKLPPSTVFAKGTKVSTLLLGIEQRKSHPAHARVFTQS